MQMIPRMPGIQSLSLCLRRLGIGVNYAEDAETGVPVPLNMANFEDSSVVVFPSSPCSEMDSLGNFSNKKVPLQNRTAL